MDVQSVPLNDTHVTDPVYHILSGSFRSISLFLLAFSPVKRSLSHLQTIPAFGPHQYLATNGLKDRVYATSWALPPKLSSWQVERSDPWRISPIDATDITATSSYITVPPPFTHIYSAGGPTGEVHRINPETGGFGEKVQEILFVAKEDLPTADKTRVALRYGSHAVEFTPSLEHAFIPVLGSNSIEVYKHESATGHLTHIASVGSPRGLDAKDGPRHVKIHPNGKILYCVTEHNNLVDAYRILPSTLEYLSSRSLLPQNLSSGESSHRFRGDTLMLLPPTPLRPIPSALVATTRGSGSSTRGWLSIFSLDDEGHFRDDNVERFETPTSGGKANAINIRPKDAAFSEADGNGYWIVLTDDDDTTASLDGVGAVRVLEWDGWGTGGVKVAAEWPSAGDEGRQGEERIQGASHAIWLD